MSNQSYFGNDLKIGRYFERGIHPAVRVQDPTIHATSTLGNRSCQRLIKVKGNAAAVYCCQSSLFPPRRSWSVLQRTALCRRADCTRAGSLWSPLGIMMIEMMLVLLWLWRGEEENDAVMNLMRMKEDVCEEVNLVEQLERPIVDWDLIHLVCVHRGGHA